MCKAYLISRFAQFDHIEYNSLLLRDQINCLNPIDVSVSNIVLLII